MLSPIFTFNTTNMEIKRCCSEFQFPDKKTKSKSIFYVGTSYTIFKFDLNQHFSPSTADQNYSGRSKSTRPPPRAAHAPPPTLPEPYFCPRRDGSCFAGTFPDDMAVAALGNIIYLIGGCLRQSPSDILPRIVYKIDTSADQPDIVMASCLLNHGKSEPIAWTIGGMIYVMPNSFSGHGFVGKGFERFDPESNSWTILPDPPESEDGFKRSCHDDPRLVRSHAVVGSTLLISLGNSNGVFSFDTSRIFWNKIFLEVIPTRAIVSNVADGDCFDFETIRTEVGWKRVMPGLILNILPFDPRYASRIGDNLVHCFSGRDQIPQFLSNFLKEHFDIDSNKDHYLCRFDEIEDIARSGSVKVSIVRFDGSSMKLRWEKFVEYSENSTLTRIMGGIGDGLLTKIRAGRDFDFNSYFVRCVCDLDDYDCTCFPKGYWKQPIPEMEPGDLYYDFELFHVSEQYEAVGVSSALFRRADQESFCTHSFIRCFLMEDGVFVN